MLTPLTSVQTLSLSLSKGSMSSLPSGMSWTGSSVRTFLGVTARKWFQPAWAEDWTKTRFFTICVVRPASSHARAGNPSASSFIIAGGPKILTSSATANRTPLPFSV